MQRISPPGLALIREYEGFSPVPYRCPAGLLTIGYGHVVREGESFECITREEAATLLVRDVESAERAVARLIHEKLSEGQFDALCSFTYNLGAGALQRSTMRRMVNRGEHESVPVELLKWVWAGGRRLKGLVMRRMAEGERYVG